MNPPEVQGELADHRLTCGRKVLNRRVGAPSAMCVSSKNTRSSPAESCTFFPCPRPWSRSHDGVLSSWPSRCHAHPGCPPPSHQALRGPARSEESPACVELRCAEADKGTGHRQLAKRPCSWPRCFGSDRFDANALMGDQADGHALVCTHVWSKCLLVTGISEAGG